MPRQLKVRQLAPRLLYCLVDRGCIVVEKCGDAPCRVKIHSKKQDQRYVNRGGKVIVNQHPAPNQHQQLTTSRRSAFVHAYHDWSTYITAFVSYPAHRQNDRTNDYITPPALSV